MRVHVRFRVNAATGEVEEFLVTDLGTEAETGVDHDAVHDQIAYKVGQVVERRPSPEQVIDESGQDTEPPGYQPDEDLRHDGLQAREETTE